MRRLLVLVLTAVLVAGACSGKKDAASVEPRPGPSWSPEPATKNGLRVVAETEGTRFLLHTKGGTVDFLPGVNVGATTPGHSPGELAISAAQYRRWFAGMGDMGFRAVRIYTIHPPAFYTELARYNRAHPRRPLYLFQGVYLPSEAYLEDNDLFGTATTDPFRAELDDAVAAVHGELTRAPQPGRAGGTWTEDVGPWLAAWIIGVEWDPEATRASDERNRSQPGYTGRYFVSTPEASPTERWLAEKLDRVATLEAEHGQAEPIAFVNWPTTDPLKHPDEPLVQEDLVGVDANHVQPTAAWPAGTFASYHAYPYYPDFQRHEAGINTYEVNGRRDNYAGYLRVQAHHAGMPVLVTEFGVPSSLGSAHFGPQGRDQGDHSEQEAARTNADLFRVIKGQRLGGAFLFEWVDEWFKFTWNTIDLQIPPDRRSLWHDPLTNEQYFGVWAVDGASGVMLGNDASWARAQAVYESRSAVREVRVGHDEEYLYVRVRLDRAADAKRIAIGFDVLPGGDASLPGQPGVGVGSEYAVSVRDDKATALVTAPNDPYRVVYGAVKGYFDPGTAPWQPYRMITNRPLTIPTTGEALPIESLEVGRLRAGATDPSARNYDSRAMWTVNGTDVEVRLPWLMVGFSDPSSRQALVVGADGALTSRPVDRVGITVATGNTAVTTKGYTWEGWQRATGRERPKAGLGVLRSTLRQLGP